MISSGYLKQGLETVRRGDGMSSQDGAIREVIADPLRDGDIRQQHEFLDHGIRVATRFLLDLHGFLSLGIETKSHFI